MINNNYNLFCFSKLISSYFLYEEFKYPLLFAYTSLNRVPRCSKTKYGIEFRHSTSNVSNLDGKWTMEYLCIYQK